MEHARRGVLGGGLVPEGEGCGEGEGKTRAQIRGAEEEEVHIFIPRSQLGATIQYIAPSSWRVSPARCVDCSQPCLCQRTCAESSLWQAPSTPRRDDPCRRRQVLYRHLRCSPRISWEPTTHHLRLLQKRPQVSLRCASAARRPCTQWRRHQRQITVCRRLHHRRRKRRRLAYPRLGRWWR